MIFLYIIMKLNTVTKSLLNTNCAHVGGAYFCRLWPIRRRITYVELSLHNSNDMCPNFFKKSQEFFNFKIYHTKRLLSLLSTSFSILSSPISIDESLLVPPFFSSRRSSSPRWAFCRPVDIGTQACCHGRHFKSPTPISLLSLITNSTSNFLIPSLISNSDLSFVFNHYVEPHISSSPLRLYHLFIFSSLFEISHAYLLISLIGPKFAHQSHPSQLSFICSN